MNVMHALTTFVEKCQQYYLLWRYGAVQIMISVYNKTFSWRCGDGIVLSSNGKQYKNEESH